jgi:hypothetical protein
VAKRVRGLPVAILVKEEARAARTEIDLAGGYRADRFNEFF